MDVLCSVILIVHGDVLGSDQLINDFLPFIHLIQSCCGSLSILRLIGPAVGLTYHIFRELIGACLGTNIPATRVAGEDAILLAVKAFSFDAIVDERLSLLGVIENILALRVILPMDW